MSSNQPSPPPAFPTPLPGMHYASFTTKSDSCRLAYQTSLLPSSSSFSSQKPKICVLPIHGFSGSSFYFIRNIAGLSSSSSNLVVCPDLRGHGASEKKSGDYHVARLAADLRELVGHIRTTWGEGEEEEEGAKIKFVPIGCSIGAAILWTYVELFGSHDFASFVFVDQGPLQDRREVGDDDDWDKRFANKGCHDEKTLREMQRAWAGQGREEAQKGLVQGCLGYLYHPDDYWREREVREAEDTKFFTEISAKCDGVWLGRLMEDHTRYDHREGIESGVDKPTLVMAGGKSGCFPLEGMKETVRRIDKGKGTGLAEWSVFEDSGHWLYYEDPERFNKEVLEFVKRGVL